MTDTDDRYEKILKSFEADTEFDVPKVDKTREASTEDWMDDVIPLDELLRARTEDEAGVVAKPYGADSLAIEDHDIISMNDLLKLQKEEQSIVAKKFNGGNGGREAHGLFSDPDNQDSDFQWHKADSSDLLKTNQPVMNPDGSISDYNWDASLVSQDQVGRADHMGNYPSPESLANEGQFDPNVADLWDESDMSERLKILSSSGITGDFDMAVNGWSNLPLDVQITLEEINVAALRGESLANEAQVTCPECDGDGEIHIDYFGNKQVNKCNRCDGTGTVEQGSRYQGHTAESEDKIEKTDVDDTEKVYEELIEESYEESTMENQNQGFKSDSDEYGVADLNADREGKNMSKDFWSKTITTDNEATVLTEYNPQPNAKMGDYNVEVERELGAKDFPDSVTEVKKNDRFLASEASWDESQMWWDNLPVHERANTVAYGSDPDLSFREQTEEQQDSIQQAYMEIFVKSQTGLNNSDYDDVMDAVVPWDQDNRSGDTFFGNFDGSFNNPNTSKMDDPSYWGESKASEVDINNIFDTWAWDGSHDGSEASWLSYAEKNGIDYSEAYSKWEKHLMGESKASEDFIHNYVDSSDIDVNDDGSLGDLDKQFEDEELPDEYYEMKNHDKLNAGDSKASEDMYDQDSIDGLQNYIGNDGSDYERFDGRSNWNPSDADVNPNSYNQVGDKYYVSPEEQNRPVPMYDSYLTPEEWKKGNQPWQQGQNLESLATEDDFNHEFDELSSLAQQKIEDTDVTPTQWDETPIPQREQLEDAIADAPVKKLDEQYDSMGDVWQCPECGFKTGFEDEFNDHEKSHVKAFDEDEISRPYDDLLDQFRS